MIDRKSCLAGAIKPDLRPGQSVVKGQFVRNLKHNEALKRFERDGDPPEFGYRVRAHDWRWTTGDEVDGLSVNLRPCARTLLCALLLHPDADMFEHVVVIDLEALAQELKLVVWAIYDPDPDGSDNPCHFNLVPADVSVEQLIITIKSWSKDIFEPSKKPPKRPIDVDVARANLAQYERVFKIYRDVRRTPGI